MDTKQTTRNVNHIKPTHKQPLVTQTIIAGNCAEVMASWPNDCINLTVTSPPYDNLRDYNGYEFPFEDIANQLYRVTKPGGVVVWIVNDATINGSETLTSFKQAIYFKQIGFNLHDTMIYLKNQIAFPNSSRYHNAFEYMFVLTKQKISTFNPLMDRVNVSAGKKVQGFERRKDGTVSRKRACHGNICQQNGMRFNYWLAYNQERGLQTQQHPATLPYSLANDHILSWSNENDIVLDPMCGSGTTILAAINNRRQYVGIDISQKYVDLTNNRIHDALKQQWLF